MGKRRSESSQPATAIAAAGTAPQHRQADPSETGVHAAALHGGVCRERQKVKCAQFAAAAGHASRGPGNYYWV